MHNPFDAGFDVVTTSHKSLRGPRGGMILCRREHAERIDKSVFPGLQGGPHMNQVAALALTLRKAGEADFRAYAAQVLLNAQALAEALLDRGVELVTGGTENHMLVIDTVASFGLDGRAAERALDDVAITVNKQITPDDPNPPLRPSGIRLGTPPATTRGMKQDDMRRLAGWIVEVLRHPRTGADQQRLRAEIEDFCLTFPVPGI